MKTTGPFSSLLWLLRADFTPSTPPGMGDVPGLCGRRWVPGRHREGRDPVALSHCCLPLAGHRRGSVNNYPLNKHIGRRRSEDTDVTFCGEITLKTHEKWKGVLSRGTRMKVSLQGHLGVSGQVRTSGLPPGPPRLTERPQPVSPCKRFGAPGPSLAPPSRNQRPLGSSEEPAPKSALFPPHVAGGGAQWRGGQTSPCQHLRRVAPQERHRQEQLLISLKCPLSFFT